MSILADGSRQVSGQQERAQPTTQRDTRPQVATSPTSNPSIESAVQGPCAPYPQNAEQADLCYQWRMAEAAEKTVTLTRVQVVLEIAEAIGLLAVVFLTLKSIGQTQSALLADRAWITCSAFKCVAIEGGQVKVYVVWQNSGRSLFIAPFALRSPA